MKLLAGSLLLVACAVDSTPPVAAPPVAVPPPPSNAALGGLGVVLERDRPVVTRVLARSPGCKAGLVGGDTIVEVDAHAVATTGDAVPLLRGAPGSPTTLVIERAGSRKTITLSRELIDAATVDVDCAHALETRPVLTGVTGDLDDDGRPEQITLVAPDAEVLAYRPKDSRFAIQLARGGRATLRAGTATWPITLAAGDRIGLTTIDIDTHDARREILLVREPQGTGESDVHVFGYDGARLHATTLRGTWTRVEAGELVVEQAPTDTGQVRVHYKVDGYVLRESARTLAPLASD